MDQARRTFVLSDPRLLVSAVPHRPVRVRVIALGREEHRGSRRSMAAADGVHEVQSDGSAPVLSCRDPGAGDRIRTGDLLLGKETRYQLRYVRMITVCPDTMATGTGPGVSFNPRNSAPR